MPVKTFAYSIDSSSSSSSVPLANAWRTASNSAAHLIPYIEPHHTILDVGCGPGSISATLAELVPDGHVTAIDIVSDIVAAAHSLAASKGVKNMSFDVADAHKLPFEDGKFDVVHAHQVLQHVSDPLQALREMRRVVKKGGVVACRETDSFSWYPALPVLKTWEMLTTKMASLEGRNPHPGGHIHVWAEEAGFARGNVEKSAGASSFSSDKEREYWGGCMEQRARDSELARKAVEKGHCTREKLDEIADEWKRFREDGTAWLGILYGQIICRK